MSSSSEDAVCLCPSEIRYSQDSIHPIFFNGMRIGETLDEILEDETSVEEIPQITVYKKDKRWFSFDNRRLWVLKKAEQFGECSEIEAKQTFHFHERKFTTDNNGKRVRVRGDPGGDYWKETLKKMETKKTEKIPLDEIRYSAEYIDKKKSPGEKLDELITRESILNRNPALPIVKYYTDDEDIQFHSLDNEKLWMLKKATKIGIIEEDTHINGRIKCTIHEDENIFDYMFDMYDEGWKIRGDSDKFGGHLWREKIKKMKQKNNSNDLFTRLFRRFSNLHM